MRIILAVLACLAACSATPAQGPEATLAEIQKVYAAKQAKAAAIQVRWNTERFIPKGSYQRDAKTMAVKGDTSIHPPEDSRITGRSNLLFVGTRFQYEYSDRTWDYKGKVFAPQNYLAAYDGKKGISRFMIPHLFPKPSVNERAPGAETDDLNDLEILPITFALRGNDGAVCRDPLETYELTGRRVPIPTGNGLELVKLIRSANLTQRIVLDPQKEYVLVRYSHEGNGAVMAQFDVQSEKHPEYGWLPSSWKLVTRKKNAISGTFEGKQVTYEAADAATNVMPKYEGGTRVFDMREATEMVHEVLPDGTDGPTIARSDLHRPEDLLPKPYRLWRSPWLYVGVGAGVVFATAYFVRVRRKRRDSTATDSTTTDA